MVPDTSAATWARAVELGARGRYAEAEALAAGLASPGDRWASLALSLLGSHRRQVGDLPDALRLDTAAWECASDAEARAEALIGLAADAVASGDADLAATRHSAAASDALRDWRTLTRWHWVGAERALLVADARRADAHARDALAACAGRSVRHEAKSRIILAATTGKAGDLPAVSAILGSQGWVTLEWPLALVARDQAASVPTAWLDEAWHRGRGATYAIEESLPEGCLTAWRAHPGVRRLREEGPGSGGE